MFSLSSPESHVPVSLSYHLSDMFFDLLNFAAETLILGGRLVYWLPVYTPEYVILNNFTFNFIFLMVFVYLACFFLSLIIFRVNIFVFNVCDSLHLTACV